MVVLYCEHKIERSDMKKGSKKENGKTRRLSIRITEDEFNEIAEKAKKKQKEKSEYILDLVKKDK